MGGAHGREAGSLGFVMVAGFGDGCGFGGCEDRGAFSWEFGALVEVLEGVVGCGFDRGGAEWDLSCWEVAGDGVVYFYVVVS